MPVEQQAAAGAGVWQGSTVHERLESIARSERGAPAVSDHGRAFSYEKLLERSAAYAFTLRRQDRGRVALIMTPGAEAVAALIGILRAGHACVPLDPSWPEARIRGLVRAADAFAAIGADAALEAARGGGATVLARPRDAVNAGAFRAARVDPGDTACIFFTSGSTGTPKGIVHSHRTMLYAARTYAAALGLKPGERMAWLSPLAFAASGATILGALLHGAELLCFDVGEGFRTLRDGLVARRATALASVSTLFRQFAAQLPDGETFPDLRVIKLGGEPVRARDVGLVPRKFSPDCVLLNGLGVTEAGCNICFHACGEGADSVVPVGRAVEGMEILIVDESGRRLPPGEVGEIVARGDFLPDGYWRDEESSRLRYAPLPDDPSRRACRTGDLGKIDEDGRLVHVGRKDAIVKVRGNRVHPAEVEAAMLEIRGVKEAAVVAMGADGADQLAAFVVAEGENRPDVASVRRALAGVLPEYMIPSRVQVVSSLPVTTSGKLDRLALRIPAGGEDVNRGAVSPRDALEVQLLAIWESILKKGGLGVTDNFFDAGGDSLGAVALMAMIDHRLGVNLPVAALAGHPTVEAMAALMRKHDASVLSSSAVLLRAGREAVSFFCVPGAGSDALALMDVARAMKYGHSFYAFQYPGLDGVGRFSRTIGEMADRFLGDLRRIQPAGPYAIGGSSFGGWVAYEMAQRLRAAGEEVALLALLDSWGPGYPVFLRGAAIRHLPLVMLRALLPLGRKEGLTWRNLKEGLKEKGMRLFASAAMSLHAGRPPHAWRFIYLQQACFSARRRYRPEPYDGPVDLFRAEVQPPAFLYEASHDLGWSTLARGRLTVHPVPGYHGAHIRNPNAALLAASLERCLARIAGSSDADSRILTEKSRRMWDGMADWWDRATGEAGHEASSARLVPLMERLLDPRAGGRILDIACGNGWFSRRLAGAGAHVTGIDFSQRLIDHANRRGRPASGSVSFRMLDATSRSELATLGGEPFDGAFCYMALMDMADLKPLFETLPRLLKDGAPFVFSIIDPEQEGLADEASDAPLLRIGLANQPAPSYHFHRRWSALRELAGSAGFDTDACERIEVPSGSAPQRYLVARMVRREPREEAAFGGGERRRHA